LNLLSDNKLVSGIRSRDSFILEHIYEKYFPIVKTFITSSGGEDHDAKDIFQETIIIIYQKVQDPAFQIEVSFQSYFNGIFKRLWYKRFRNIPVAYEVDDVKPDIARQSYEEYSEIDALQSDNSKYSLMYKHLLLLKEECIKLLKLFFSKLSLQEISQQMGYKNENYTKKRKFFCKEALIESIKKDPDYKELL
jgi:RNA polymerase sigma factor (sigma-70 family)